MEAFTSTAPSAPGWYWATYPDSEPFMRQISQHMLDENYRWPDLKWGPRIPSAARLAALERLAKFAIDDDDSRGASWREEEYADIIKALEENPT